MTLTGVRAAAPPATPTRRRSWVAYRAVARVAARSLLVYRRQFLFSLIGGALTFASLLFLWRAILGEATSSMPLTWPQMRTYLFVSFLVGTIVSPWTDWRTAVRINDGSVASDLVKPVDFQRARFAETTGFALVETGAGIVIGLAVVLPFGGLSGVSVPQLGMFLLSMAFVLPLKFCIVYATSLLCFWTQGFFGVNTARLAITQLFSGALVPLTVFPAALRTVAEVLPFQATVYTPALILLGEAQGDDAWQRIAVQAGWVVLLWFGARWMWNTASRRLTVHGG